MSLIDLSTYDLTTPPGQQNALQDIIEEQNRQFEQSQHILNIKVVGYTNLTITTANGTSIYQVSFRHGLGFRPIVVSFNNNPVTEYSPTPDLGLELAINPDQMDSNAYITVDEQNVYWNVVTTGTVGTTEPVNIYILNLPAQVTS